jgi:FkbH-like protein
MSHVDQADANSVSLRVAANFTVEAIEEFLAYWLSELQIPASIRFAPYNQVFQQLLEGGLLRSNRDGVNLVALDLEAWLVAGPLPEASAQLERTVADFLEVLRSAGSQGAGGVVLVFPSSTHPEPPRERAAAIAAAKESILTGCGLIAGWTALDLASAVKRYSVSETHDPFTHQLGDIPFSEEMYAAAATAAARWIRSIRNKPRKVIVLDCDNTLWQGICGEGPVQVTPPFRRLHEFMLRQRDDGVLLALASKNNEADVMAVLDSETCVLKAEDFTAWQINWQLKSDNLKALSEDLGLALNSFVFLDDSPYECMEVRNACPEVMAISLPPDPEGIPSFLDHLWAFDRPAATEEDRHRAEMYQAERQRADLSRRALTPEEFLASLHIEIQVAPVTEADLARVAQLAQRTTQFNVTGVLHTAQSLTSKLAQAGNEGWTVRVRDIFGDYGLVGAILVEPASDSLRVDTFLLSCRALGRGVEDRMIEDLKRWAQERGAERLVFPVVPTARNRPALEFLNRLCEIPVDAKEPFECVLSTSGNSSLWRPATMPVPVAQTASGSPASLPLKANEGETLERIATCVQSAAAVLDAVRNQKKQRPADSGPFVLPVGAVEDALARIWSECLRIDPIGTKDNFFDFGGQSLIATRVLTRVRSEFGVEMSLTNLFENPTVVEMAAHISKALSAGSKSSDVGVSRQI